MNYGLTGAHGFTHENMLLTLNWNYGVYILDLK